MNVVKVRKTHQCAYCERDIQPGEKAEYLTGRSPRYDEQDHQIGIHYYHYYMCELCEKEIATEISTNVREEEE